MPSFILIVLFSLKGVCFRKPLVLPNDSSTEMDSFFYWACGERSMRSYLDIIKCIVGSHDPYTYIEIHASEH